MSRTRVWVATPSKPRGAIQPPFWFSSGVIGFTLLELIFVATILTFIATISIPRLRMSFASLQLRDLVSDTVSLARYAQMRAIADREIRRLVFDEEKGLLKLEGFKKIEEIKEALTEEERWYLIRSRRIPDTVSVELESTEGNKKTKGMIRFYPDGTADGVRIKMSIPSQEKVFTVLIEPATGYVTVKEAQK